jgi:hypothetical protein
MKEIGTTDKSNTILMSHSPADLAEPFEWPRASNGLTSLGFHPSLEVVLYKANPTSGGVTASTEMLAAKRHAGVHAPVIVCKMIIANQQMAYAA